MIVRNPRAPWGSLALAAALAVGVAPAPAAATTLVKLSNDQLVDASDAIVRGTVVQVWTELDGSSVWTRARIEVAEVLKGDAPATVVVDELGGTYGAFTTEVDGAVYPRFDEGEEAVFFLEHLDSGITSVVGGFQGKFTVRLDPVTHGSVVTRFTRPFTQDYDHRFVPIPRGADRLTLDALVDQVHDRVAKGWDGQPIPGVSNDKLRRINKVSGLTPRPESEVAR